MFGQLFKSKFDIVKLFSNKDKKSKTPKNEDIIAKLDKRF